MFTTSCDIPLQFRGHYSVSGSPSVHVTLQTTVTFTDVSTGPSELLLSTSDIVRQLPHDFLYPFFVANGNAHSSMLQNDSCIIWMLLLMYLLHTCVHYSVFWIHCIITVIHQCFRQTVVISMNDLWTDSDCRLCIINTIFMVCIMFFIYRSTGEQQCMRFALGRQYVLFAT